MEGLGVLVSCRLTSSIEHYFAGREAGRWWKKSSLVEVDLFTS